MLSNKAFNSDTLEWGTPKQTPEGTPESTPESTPEQTPEQSKFRFRSR